MYMHVTDGSGIRHTLDLDEVDETDEIVPEQTDFAAKGGSTMSWP
jgi:hypothetical protein